jgi:hypothetical protein
MGVHKSQVTRWIDAGMPVEPDGTIDAEKASAWVHLKVDPTQRIRAARESAHRSERIRQRTAEIPEPSRPACVDHLTRDVDAALVAALPGFAATMPTYAAIAARAVGVPLPLVYALFKASQHFVMAEVTDWLTRLNVPEPAGCESWAEAPLWNPAAFNRVNWPALAEEAGEPLDVEGWEAFTRALPLFQGDIEAAPPPVSAAKPGKGRRRG